MVEVVLHPFVVSDFVGDIGRRTHYKCWFPK